MGNLAQLDDEYIVKRTLEITDRLISGLYPHMVEEESNE